MKLPFAPSLRQGIKGCSGRLISLGGLRHLGLWRDQSCNITELRHLLVHREARFFHLWQRFDSRFSALDRVWPDDAERFLNLV